ncbi:cyclic nucleotide-binding domain protein (macronuclear) [Tetrahymena thermophila SB210]|uniref:Cyclic nucleotide-binding domain protein n=1 Tax=Tetrahymena thermophila (strain SB210) TaxID=312017 RepID=Q237T0_TETTS|nr:cyclic nucleotide-binding domain protein [Tetrahymena thermophila SB210]EAR92661.2 cyclic nucleotide-binding domain protein [Tetrahymena thermophila SB210]|eukprot:XP_001012906.2 cyclic nucleotide-binding domain protein [Tetrahymena thermophila SB210]
MISILDESQQEILNVMRNIGDNKDRNENTIQIIRSFLTKTKLFKSIADEPDYQYILKQTSHILKYQKYKYGEFLFHQGELGDNLYFVLGGQGSVYLPKEDYELKTDLIYYQKIGQMDSESLKIQDKEDKSVTKNQTESQKNQSLVKNSCELNIQDFKNEQSNGIIDKNQKNVILENVNNMLTNRVKIQEDDDEVSILALNEKHQPRYFRISRDFAMYKRVRYERYLDHFGELAAEEQFNRRLASVVASSKDQDFEVAYISLKDFKVIFSTVIENLYLVQNTLCEQLINTSKKQTINFSYLFSETIKLERGQTIFTEGTPVNGIYIVRKGTISIKKAIIDQKSPIQLAILSQKDLFGHEDAFTNHQMTRTISAVSEAYGTEVQFAKIDDILAFLSNHKEFEKELKRKSELKISFYKKRITNIENLFKNNTKFQYQIDKKISKIPLDGEDQNAIFNKFLQNSREQLVSQEANTTIRSSQNIIQVSKLLEKSGSQIMEAGNVLKSRQLKSPQMVSKQSPKQQNIEIQQHKKKQESNQTQEQQRMQVFKGRNNLRTRSLINIRTQIPYDQNNNAASQLLIGKNNKQEIQETSLERAENQVEQKQQNIIQINKSPSSKLQRQATFSQYSSNKQTQQTLNNLEEARPSLEVDINLFNEKEQLEGKHVYQNKKISKKLKEAIAGQWNSKPENWTLDSIEKQIKINSQNLTSNKNQNNQSNTHSVAANQSKSLKLTYLHNDMDSFEYAKKFVILKRQHKKTQYLHQSQTNLSNLNTVEGYKKQQQAKEQKAKSPISSPQSRFDDKIKQMESNTEDPFFNPHISIQKFSRFLLNNQQTIKSIDILPNSNDLRSSKKFGTLGRLSLNEISSPMARSFISSQNIRKPSTSQSKCKTNDINKESLICGEKEKEEKQKIVKLRQCSSTVIDYNFDQDISEDFNEELQTSFLHQNKQTNQKEIFNLQKLQEENIKQEENQSEVNQNENKLNSSDKIQKQTDFSNKQTIARRLQYQNPQKRFSQQFDEKTYIPLIQFNGIQNNKENQALFSKDQNIENIDKNNKLLSHHKGFLLNISQSPIPKNNDSPNNLQKIFEEQASENKQENQQQQQHKMTESCPNRNRVLSHHAFSSEVDLENNQNNINENEIKYFLNANYVKMNESFSPIIIQKLQSQKQQTNISSHFSKHQISFVQPSTTFIDRCVSSHDSPMYQTNSFQKAKQINFGYSSSNTQQQLSKNCQQLLSRNIKSQIGAFRHSNKFALQQQQQSQMKANNLNNLQMQINSIQKQQLLSQNVNSIQTNLNSFVLKQLPVNIQINESKFYQVEGQEDLVSPIHHSSLSPNLRKTNIERIQSSSKQGRNNNSNQISSFNQHIDVRDSFSPSSKQNNNIQSDQFMKRFSIDTFNTPKDDSKNSNIKFTNTNDQSFNSHNTNSNTPKDIQTNKSTNKTLQGFSQQSNMLSNTKQLKKSLFNKEDQPKNNILSNAFPNKNKTASHSKQKSQESIRDDFNTPIQTLLGMKKRQNIHLSNKFNQNQYLCSNSDTPQNQLLTITPYQPLTSQSSAQNSILTKFNSSSINQIAQSQNN